MGSITEKGPRRREKDLPVLNPAERRKLPFNLVGSQEVIGLQPLDVIPLAEPKGMIARRRSASVFFADDRNPFRGKSPGHFGRSIRRPIINNDNLLAMPGLRDRGLYRAGDPLLSVICGDEN